MSTVRIYKSTDTGAPAHPSEVRGSMAALLRACLVTGYGSGEDFKSPAGWEEPFAESGNYAVFRAAEGARQFYQIDDNQAAADVAYMRAYESMSDVGSGEGNWFAGYFGKQYSTSYPGEEWWVIADERSVYVFLSGYYGLIPHGFGEFSSFVPDDPYNSFCAGHRNTSAISGGSRYTNLPYVTTVGESDGNSFRIHKSARGTLGAPATGVVCGLPPCPAGGSSYMSPAQSLLKNNVVNYPFVPYFVSCNRQYEDNSARFVRGALRGLYIPIGFQPGTHGETWTDPSSGETYLFLSWNETNSDDHRGQFMVDITGSWD